MKILQICNIDMAVEAFLKPFHNILVQQGYIVHYACTNTGPCFKELQHQGLHMIHIPIDREIKPISNLKSITLLTTLMKKERYDVVHVHTPLASILGRVAAKLAGVKQVIYTAHGFYFHENMSKLNYLFLYSIEKFFARYFTSMLHLVSKEDYELCIRKHFKTENSIFHINNGVDFRDRFNPKHVSESEKIRLRNEFSINKNDIVFTFIGRLVKEKGIFELIDAFQELTKSNNDVKLLIIGGLSVSERDQKSYRRLLKIIKDNTCIIPTSFRKDIPELLAITDVFVLPSHREGLPLVILEAMAMKKPIIATNIRGCREEVIHNKNGFLVEKENSLELYTRLQQLANDKALRLQFGENSRKIVKRQFDDKRTLGSQLEIYQSLFN
ncbi:Glycosyltransferase involved in cell wall bisynthesis [Seinonella peptonophila]|uniref:Glycosyltransferase involved in cell wall bisynthesis n=1 Tax=Seinonella peptonophila TaxID=112248 RepID=A0A1M5ADB8_9BACL|nr:glycosyltransferase family 4 protein [Seinonella peptonophila]SHF28258.1 Glycosyltransferase involved in cell wall bisynthesis [Seinonella peptonophila]